MTRRLRFRHLDALRFGDSSLRDATLGCPGLPTEAAVCWMLVHRRQHQANRKALFKQIGESLVAYYASDR